MVRESKPKTRYMVVYGSTKSHLQVETKLKAKNKKEAIKKACRKIKVTAYRTY